MKSKIIFMEPYVSFGGHNLKHLTTLPKVCRERGIPHDFIVEKHLSEHKSVFKGFMAYSKISRLGEESYIKQRIKEFQSVLMQHEGSVYISLTTFDLDFLAWLELFRKKNIQEHILSSRKKIIIQSTADVYRPISEITKQDKRNLSLLKNHVFFGFYNDALAASAASLVPELPAVSLSIPSFTKKQLKALQKKRKALTLSFLGRYEFIKGFHVIPELMEKMKKNSFMIQLHPVNDENYLLYHRLEALKTKETKIFTRSLTPKEYQTALYRTKIGILPYDPQAYAVRASGILEEYAVLGIPVVVPKNTWMAECLKTKKAVGTAYDPGKPNDLLKVIQKILNKYQKYHLRSERVAKRIMSSANLEFFIDHLLKGDFKKISKKEKIYCKDFAPVEKGPAEKLLTLEPKNIKHVTVSQKVFQKHQFSFWHGVYYGQMENREMARNHFSQYFQTQGKKSDDFFRNLQRLTQGENHLWFQDKELKPLFMEKLKPLKSKKEQTALDLYNLASIYQKFGVLKDSKELFRKILQRKRNAEFHAGVCFHLGEIFQAEGKSALAADYFRKCLDKNPHHQKAKENLILCV